MAFNLSNQGNIAVFYDDDELGLQQKFIGKGTIVTTITGMKYRPNYKSTLEKLDLDVVVEAKPEPDNPYDPNAIAVYYERELIGYVPKKDIPFIMPNVDDTGTECVIDNMDDGYVGIKLKASFKHLGKRPQYDLPPLKFLDNESLMTEDDFRKKYLKRGTIFTSKGEKAPKQKKPKEGKGVNKDIVDYSFDLELELGDKDTRDLVESMIDLSIALGKEVYFEGAFRDDEVVMVGHGVNMKFPISHDDITEAVMNGQKVKIIPNLSIKTRRNSSINTKVFIYKEKKCDKSQKTYNPFEDEKLKVVKKMSFQDIMDGSKKKLKYFKDLETDISNGVERFCEVKSDGTSLSLFDMESDFDTEIWLFDEEIESYAEKGYKIWAKITKIEDSFEDFYVGYEIIVVE